MALDYQPINYDSWNFDGKGSNIFQSLSPIEKKIWGQALPFQDKREDVGHAENVTYFTLKIREIVGGDRKIIIPAAILHDIGWSQLTETERKLFYETADDGTRTGTQVWQRYEPILRTRHQEQGVKLAQKLLENIQYPEQNISEIIEIISQHDTRKGSLSLNDEIVKDADKLWRFTVPVHKIMIEKRACSPEEAFKISIDSISKEGFLFLETSKEIAKIELENTRNYQTRQL